MIVSQSKVLILFNSSHGHLRQIAEAEKRGIEAAGGSADIFRVASFPPTAAECNGLGNTETEQVPTAEPSAMLEYDAILFGISTSYGSSAASEWRAFWDKTGGIWFRKGLFHKAAGVFASSANLSSGLENIFTTMVTICAHHGMYFIPMGYKDSLALLETTDEVHGGTPWGAGTFSGKEGLREPSDLEVQFAEAQGQAFYKALDKVNTLNFCDESCS